MNDDALKAEEERREEIRSRLKPAPKPVSTPSTFTDINTLQAGPGNAAIAAVATTAPQSEISASYLPLQSGFGNFATARANELPPSNIPPPQMAVRSVETESPEALPAVVTDKKPERQQIPPKETEPSGKRADADSPTSPEKSKPKEEGQAETPIEPTENAQAPGPTGEKAEESSLKEKEAGKGKGTKKPAGEAGEKAGASGSGPAAPGTEGEPAAPGATPPAMDTSSFDGILQSLAATPPSASGAALKTAEAATPNLQTQGKAELKDSFPEVERPTGLPRLEERTSVDPLTLQEGGTLGLEDEKGREGKPPDVEHKQPQVPLPAKGLSTEVREPAEEDEGSWWERLFNRIRKFTGSLPTRDPGVSTDAGPRPNVDMTGEANPDQNARNQVAATEEVSTRRAEAATATTEYLGENEIYPNVPKETLRPSYTPGAPNTGAGSNVEKVEGLNGEELMKFDQSTGTWYAGKLGEEQEKHRVGQEDYQMKSAEAREDGSRKIENETEQARVEQEAIQGAARGDVEAERGRWREENQKIQDEYLTQSEIKRQDADKQVVAEAAKAESDADAELVKAENKAKDEKKKAEEKAAEEKRKEEAKPRSWWQRVKGAVSSVLNAIKKVVNAIFDGLRALVKGIFELAKKLVRGIIELARMVIVGLIKVFGEILKGLVSIALAAFPETAKKARAWIDDRVDGAVNAVNAAAEKLKKVTDAILDFVASTLDSLLGLVQAIQNAILTVVGMLITGEIFELLRRLGYLVQAAKTAPEQFETAALEELLGGNLDDPLSPGELEQARAAGISVPAAKGNEEGSGATETAEDPNLPKAPWGEHNVGVDEVDHNMELSPELAEELAEKRENGENTVDLASSDDESRTMDSVMSEVNPAPAEASTEQVKNPDDGLSPTQRAGIKWEMMKDGIAKWWSENWQTVLLAAAAALLGFIALNIVTGGAITAAIVALMPIITALFIGLTVIKLAEYVKNYVALGWEGQIRPAGKNLAKALAAGAIELISYLTFKAAGAALKGAKALAKGGIKLASSGFKLAKAGVKAVVRGAKFVVAQGKVLFRGIAKSGIGKFAKKIKDFGAKLLERLRFKKFRILISGRRFVLEGYINPWIELGSGDIVWVDKLTKKGKYGKEVAGKTKAGEIVEGILVRGSKAKPDYRHIADVFFKETVSKLNVIHHAIEQQVMKRFKGLFTLAEIHSGANLRTILRGAFNSEVHLSRIRKLWNNFYTILEAQKLPKEVAKRAFELYRKSVDDFLYAIDKFMKESPDVAKALAKKDAVTVRRLLKEKSDELLKVAAPDAKAAVATALKELQ